LQQPEEAWKEFVAASRGAAPAPLEFESANALVEQLRGTTPAQRASLAAKLGDEIVLQEDMGHLRRYRIKADPKIEKPARFVYFRRVNAEWTVDDVVW
jgi:hypothetical protein